jgi:multicomponent Na+:H+ antiporter subunit F
MNTLVLAVAMFLLAGLVVALIAAARGPTPADRMLMALLIGTTGTGILVLLAYAMHLPALVDVALVLALLAAIGGIAFAKRAWQHKEGEHD